jgi:murein DD-endopeptidase MepM/ murein hydrolase activator NlpD
VAVRHYSSSGTGNYTLSVQFAAGGGTTDDHGNTCATATHITLSSYGIGSRTGNIETVGDIDYFSVDVPQGTLTIFTTGGTDTYGYLKNSSCTELLNGRNDDYLEDRNFSIRQWVPAGRYYVAVKHWNGTGTGDYTLNVEFVTHLFTWPVDPTNRTDGSSFACGDSSPCFWISDTNHDLAIIWRDALSFQRVTASGPHLGADYNLGSGDNDEGEYVYPIAWGTISAVYSDYCGYGNIILVRHDTSFGTYTSMYAHINPLASGMPVEGTLVNPSQPIALVGKGLKSDCFSLYPAHLHFEIRRGDSVAEYATDHDRVGNAYGACIGVDQPTNTCPQQQVNPNEFIIRHN